MDTGLRSRRLENEWKLLKDLVQFNAPLLEILGRETQADRAIFHVAIHETSGITKDEARRILVDTHTVQIEFPRFFPAVPIEARLLRPLFHPNIDPNSGFVCLWGRFYAGDTIVEALLQLQQIIAWKLVNLGVDHSMQPDAVAWYRDPKRRQALPLEFTPLRESEEYALQKNSGPDFCESHQPRRRIVGAKI